jgi:hypothetical protein
MRSVEREWASALTERTRPARASLKRSSSVTEEKMGEGLWSLDD